MAGEAQLVRLIPIIVRLFPQLIKTTFYRGSVVVANKVTPATDEQLDPNLERKIDRRREDQSKDNQMVLKVSAALKCVEENFNNTTLIKEFIFVACESLLKGVQTKACGQRMFEKIATCIREHALRQDTPRAAHRSTRYGRPAKGHGHGRSGF